MGGLAGRLLDRKQAVSPEVELAPGSPRRVPRPCGSLGPWPQQCRCTCPPCVWLPCVLAVGDERGSGFTASETSRLPHIPPRKSVSGSPVNDVNLLMAVESGDQPVDLSAAPEPRIQEEEAGENPFIRALGQVSRAPHAVGVPGGAGEEQAKRRSMPGPGDAAGPRGSGLLSPKMKTHRSPGLQLSPYLVLLASSWRSRTASAHPLSQSP